MVLNYKTFGSGFPLVILHGLLGSLDNWQGIAKKLAEQFQVYIIDQRNHGKSPHSEEFNIEILAADLDDFFTQNHIAKAHLMGHSMGGKAAMAFALGHSAKVEKLIVVDIAPTEYEEQHSAIFKALFAIDLNQLNSREEAEAIIKRTITDNTTVQFLMKGLHRNDANAFEWKFNLQALYDNYALISGGIESKNVFTHPTLFIKGEHSDYLNAGNYDSVNHFFPNNQLTEIKEAGHWVHADQPAAFLAVVLDWLQHK